MKLIVVKEREKATYQHREQEVNCICRKATMYIYMHMCAYVRKCVKMCENVLLCAKMCKNVLDSQRANFPSTCLEILCF